ncbi:uncharacterized protein BCR38DRAFT_504044 [Pseudomassariella vexata]|uniref:Heterokaryon incompatibility domain-containing protein n=1 Tax=Pseudomassariella vexata TaxID=1141098 RepID=A0A1Y2EGN0_9PEZI|nr:uncharacterized protein BCR38DRAFT_504044 [Pseudomassariella vexata]ORY70464.1 hypothetical protein BCR38DRAFT_504044 [Pseudomassariella vexata]
MPSAFPEMDHLFFPYTLTQVHRAADRALVAVDGYLHDPLASSHLGDLQFAQQQFELLRDWIRLCDGNHECYRIQESPTSALKISTRVIDVGTKDDPRLRLIEPADNLRDKFIALSHCWGKVTKDLRICTEEGNIKQFRNNINLSRLPRTFQDAVIVTRASESGISGSIPFASYRTMKATENLKLRKWKTTYSSAYVTIAATSAKSSGEGFLIGRPSRYYATVSTPSGPLHLAEAIDNFQADVERGILNTRAWVLQERALSRRTIHFTATQVYWERRRGVHCETLAQLCNPQSQFLGDHEFPRIWLIYFKNERIKLIQHLHTVYSALKLTKEVDRSVAIAGLQKRIATAFQTRFDHGIFWKYFERSILWCALERESLSRIKYARDHSVPSWSWMAYSGTIKYLEIPFGEIVWTGDLENPFADGSREKISEQGLVARASAFTVQGPNQLIILDMDTQSDPNRNLRRCITVGKQEKENQLGELLHYVLLIRPILLDDFDSVFHYERVGLGSLVFVELMAIS